MKDVPEKFVCVNEGRPAHAIGEEYGKTITIDGGRWEVNVDTFIRGVDNFPASFYGDCCDVSIRTNIESINFIIKIGNVISLYDAIMLLSKEQKQELLNKRISISNLIINGEFYSTADIDISARTPLKYYVTFSESMDTDKDTYDKDDLLKDYDLVVGLNDLTDIVRRVAENWKRYKK